MVRILVALGVAAPYGQEGEGAEHRPKRERCEELGSSNIVLPALAGAIVCASSAWIVNTGWWEQDELCAINAPDARARALEGTLCDGAATPAGEVLQHAPGTLPTQHAA